MECLSSSSQFRVLTVCQFLTFIFFYICLSNGATFNFVNECGFTVWPGISNRQEISGRLDFSSTGFELKKGKSVSLEAPSGWMGSIWGRTGCNFNVSGNGSCTTGDCNTGQIECNGTSYKRPVTLAEFALDQFQGLDYYDVSIVEGYNLPMLIEATVGSADIYGYRSCAKTGCVEDLYQRCPPELKGGGGCRSACRSPEYCCNSTFGTSSTCKRTAYAQLFKSACP